MPRFRATVLAAAARPSWSVASVSRAFRITAASLSSVSLTVLADTHRTVRSNSGRGGPASRRVLLNDHEKSAVRISSSDGAPLVEDNSAVVTQASDSARLWRCLAAARDHLTSTNAIACSYHVRMFRSRAIGSG